MIDGETFNVGDVVYVILDEKVVNLNLNETEYDSSCICAICEEGYDFEDEKQSPMLECHRCVGGFHLNCLDPPLGEVPQGEWICPNCFLGEAPKHRQPTCAREIFLQGLGMGLARIDTIWMHPETREEYFTGSWYSSPEETHTGRQPHHSAREVYLTNHQDSIPFAAILRKAFVLSQREFDDGGENGDDVFMCRYAYDPSYQRFVKLGEWHCDFSSDDVVSSDEDEYEESMRLADQECMRATKLCKQKKKAYKALGHRRRQGGSNLTAHLGVKSIPEPIDEALKISNIVKQASRALALHTHPSSLPCREKECEFVRKFLDNALSHHNGGKCLYISGIPGTGKTATVLQAIRSLRKDNEVGKVPKFRFVEINGLRLPSPQHAYSALYEGLTGEALGPNTAVRRLENMFLGATNKKAMHHTIVLLDEMDSLINRNQNVLYNLFDWPARARSCLTVIGIANTMDLPQRLHPRIASRIAGEKLVFHPYSKDQLINIMEVRLREIPVFEEKAIQYVTRKVANCSGDVRRCLELCRRAAEIAMERQENIFKVKITDVDVAIREAFGTPQLKLLQQSPLLYRLVLVAVELESHYAGQCDVRASSVYERLKELYSVMTREKLNFSNFSDIVADLVSQRLLICETGRCRLGVKIAMNVRSDDLIAVIKADKQLSWLDDRIRGIASLK